MNEVVRFLVFGIPLVGIGLLVDRILTRPHKAKLYDKLLAIWLKIDETRFPDLGKRVLSRVHRTFDVSLDRGLLRQTLVRLILLSWLVTSLAGSIGTFMDGTAEANPYTWLPIFPVYFVNGFFDALTLAITFLALRLASRVHSFFAIPLVAANAAIAAAIAIASLPLLAWSHSEAYERNWPGSGDTVLMPLQAPSMLQMEIQEFMLPQIERHLKENPGKPFVFDQKNWRFGNRLAVKDFHVSVTFKPETTIEQVRATMRLQKRMIERENEAMREGFVFVSKYTLTQFYATNLRQIVFDFERWAPKLEGSIRAAGPEWQTSANGVSLAVGKWSFVLVSGTTLVPAIILAFALTLLAALKLTRDVTAWVTKYFIERTTEEDPRIYPEKFAPFTLLCTVLGTFLYVVREFASWVADKLI